MFENLLKKLIRGFLNAVGYTSKQEDPDEAPAENVSSGTLKSEKQNITAVTQYPQDYLSSSAIIFSGDFQSDVSTVNNDVRHYDNATFEKRFQEPKEGDVMNGWWNPKGGAIFRFLNATVTRCLDKNGDDVSGSPLLGNQVTNAGDRSGGKMVDLDPQMQMTSEIWGVRISIVAADGTICMEGRLMHTGFRDLQTRQLEAKPVNGQPLGASFCTVIEEVKWADDLEAFPVLQEMKNETNKNRLRIHLTTFGYYYSHADGRFSMGRVVGVIAPWHKHTPLKFAATRRLYGSNPFGDPFGFTNFAVNTDSRRLRLDLGMSLPIINSTGKADQDYTTLSVGVDTQGGSAKKYEAIGEVTISDPDNWLAETGGIAGIDLTDEQISLLENNPLVLYQNKDNKVNVLANESEGGWYIRADQNVQRLDPGDSESTDLYVYRWGRPSSGEEVEITLDPKVTGAGGAGPGEKDPPKAPLPPNNIPTGKVNITKPSPTDSYGKTSVLLTGVDPQNPRKYIDGQIYLHSYNIEGVSKLSTYFNDKIIVHLRDAYTVPDNPAWNDVRDIWVQFGNLYPIMSHHIADFNVAGELLKRREILLLAFTRDINDPMYMPVTRDMSAAKMEVLVKWLKNAPDDEKGTLEAAPAAHEDREYSADFTNEVSNDLMSKMTRAKGGDPKALKALKELKNKNNDDSSTKDH
ncbi:MAG: hypothetical protein WBB45_20625 [Cyclobacteriaceae bacterium]